MNTEQEMHSVHNIKIVSIIYAVFVHICPVRDLFTTPINRTLFSIKTLLFLSYAYTYFVRFLK